MKIALVGITGIPLGRHKIRDARLDQADKLVKADSKTSRRSMSSAEPFPLLVLPVIWKAPFVVSFSLS